MIAKLFDVFALVFDKIPGLNKIKGGRTILGFIGMAVVAGLKAYGIGNVQMLNDINIALMAFIGLALNAKGRE